MICAGTSALPSNARSVSTRALALLVERLPHGGERGRGEARLLDIVEAGDRHVLRRAEAARRERIERAERHGITRGHDHVEHARALVEEPPAAAQATR